MIRAALTRTVAVGWCAGLRVEAERGRQREPDGDPRPPAVDGCDASRAHGRPHYHGEAKAAIASTPLVSWRRAASSPRGKLPGVKPSPLAFAPAAVEVETRFDGTIRLRSPMPLEPTPEAITAWLEHWAVPFAGS